MENGHSLLLVDAVLNSNTKCTHDIIILNNIQSTLHKA